jgi:hypothetical protein
LICDFFMTNLSGNQNEIIEDESKVSKNLEREKSDVSFSVESTREGKMAEEMAFALEDDNTSPVDLLARFIKNVDDFLRDLAEPN